jgi:hypothetical protein
MKYKTFHLFQAKKKSSKGQHIICWDQSIAGKDRNQSFTYFTKAKYMQYNPPV